MKVKYNFIQIEYGLQFVAKPLKIVFIKTVKTVCVLYLAQ